MSHTMTAGFFSESISHQALFSAKSYHRAQICVLHNISHYINLVVVIVVVVLISTRQMSYSMYPLIKT